MPDFQIERMSYKLAVQTGLSGHHLAPQKANAVECPSSFVTPLSRRSLHTRDRVACGLAGV